MAQTNLFQTEIVDNAEYGFQKELTLMQAT